MVRQHQQDHYETLGLARTASPDEIKAAFRRLAINHHPDRNPDDPNAAVRFKEINSAYQVLSDPQRRMMYDRLGDRAEEPGSPFAAGGPFAGGVVDIGDIAVDGILGDLLGVFGVGKGGDRGELKETLEVNFEEAAFGCEKELHYERLETCSDCRGNGSAPGSIPDPCPACKGRGRVRFQSPLLPMAVERPCSRCRGSGRIVRMPCVRCKGAGLMTCPNVVKVTLPAGIESGTTRLHPGGGNQTRPDRAAGDLEVTVVVRPHPFFKRVDDDVTCRVPISFTQAVLGGEADVPTLEGKLKVRIPPGAQPGLVLRLKGKGIARRLGMGRGDQKVELTIEVPSSVTERQADLLKAFAKELGEDVQPQRRTFTEKLRTLFG